MTQHWSPRFNGNNRGVAGAHRQTTPFNNTMSHQTQPLSPPRHPASRSASLRPPMTPVHPTDSSSFRTPTKGQRAAPQCSTLSSSSRSPYKYSSPTSVIGGAAMFDHHGRPPTTPQSSLRARSRIGSGYYEGSPSPSPSPRHFSTHRRHGIVGGYPSGSAVASSLSSPRCHYVATENKKYKTEMCKNMTDHGYCRFGENCHYAHSEEERHSPSVEDLMKDDRLLLPCSIMVSTGFCPYDHRCKSLHDPRVVNFPMLGDEDSSNVVVLEHCTKAKRSGDTIPDRLYHRNLNSIRQVNPLVAPYIWEECRPSRSNDEDLEFRDTYDLVCNVGPDGGGANVFPSQYARSERHPVSSLRARSVSGQHLYSNKNNPQGMLSELHKLCIVLQMRTKSDVHLDFIYAPQDCMNGQPCMVLQTRYFHLLDFSPHHMVSIENIITEVPSEVYHAGKYNNPSAFACAHDVAFDSKGKRSCNLSIWFNTTITTCSSSKAKKMSKKDDPWHLDDSSGSLFCMPNNEEFEAYFPATSPYVSMQPIDDRSAGHDLIKSILEHRIAVILSSRGFHFHQLPNQLGQLGKDYVRMKADLERWSWPKTSNKDHFSKTKEEQNQTLYSPPAEVWCETNSSIWNSFVMNLNGSEGSVAAASRKRLPVFRSIAAKTDIVDNNLPRIHRSEAPRSIKYMSRLSHPESLSEATWRELILGEGEDKPWKKTIESHVEGQRRSGARSTPVSPTIIQNLFSR